MTMLREVTDRESTGNAEPSGPTPIDAGITLSTEACEEIARVTALYRGAKSQLAQAEEAIALARTQLAMLDEATRSRLAVLGIEPEAIAEDRLIVKPDGSVHYRVVVPE